MLMITVLVQGRVSAEDIPPTTHDLQPTMQALFQALTSGTGSRFFKWSGAHMARKLRWEGLEHGPAHHRTVSEDPCSQRSNSV